MGIAPTPEYLFIAFLILTTIASLVGYRQGYKSGYRNGYQDRQVRIRWAHEKLRKDN
jgi:hypothetical protein